MKKNLLTIVIALVLGTSLILAACTSNAPAPAPAPTPAPAPAPAPAPIKLVLAGYFPPSYYGPGTPFAPYGDAVNAMQAELAKVNVNVDVYLSGELLKDRELIPGLEAGTADIIFQTVSITTGAWPVNIFQELPFLWKDADHFKEQATYGKPIRKVVDKQLEEKYGIKSVAMATQSLEPIYTLKPVRTPADMKGLKIRQAGVGQAWGLEALGAAPVGLVSSEMYEALSRGTIDGLVTQPATIDARKLYEVLKYVIDVPYVGEALSVYLTMDTWNTLPQNARDVITSVGRQYEENLFSYQEKEYEKYKATYTKAGMETITLTPQELQAFVDATRGTWDKFSEAAGPEVAAEIIKLAGW